jgi:hypothetical protein
MTASVLGHGCCCLFFCFCRQRGSRGPWVSPSSTVPYTWSFDLACTYTSCIGQQGHVSPRLSGVTAAPSPALQRPAGPHLLVHLPVGLAAAQLRSGPCLGHPTPCLHAQVRHGSASLNHGHSFTSSGAAAPGCPAASSSPARLAGRGLGFPHATAIGFDPSTTRKYSAKYNGMSRTQAPLLTTGTTHLFGSPSPLTWVA